MKQLLVFDCTFLHNSGLCGSATFAFGAWNTDVLGHVCPFMLFERHTSIAIYINYI